MLLKKINFTILITLFACILISGQDSTVRKIAILPFKNSGLYEKDVISSESILRFELEKYSGIKLISQKLVKNVPEAESCNEPQCAVEIGKELAADNVFGCKLGTLGEKIIVQYFLVDVISEKELLIEQTNSATVEDLETVMKRIAKSVSTLKTFTESAEVGNITQSESNDVVKRGSHRDFGISFGYLFPQNGYKDKEKSFTVDFKFGYELEDFDVGLMLGIRNGFAMNIYSSYLFARGDFTPYVGGAFGFHWVMNEVIYHNKGRGDGFEIILRTGLKLFRTYSFTVVLNLDYAHTFNDFNSDAIIFTIGLL